MTRYVSQEICKAALTTWGKQTQLMMLLEEMSELQKEVLKNINRNKDNVAAIAEETADVLIMLDQLIVMYDIRDAVGQQVAFKLNRVKEYLGIK